MNKKVFQMPKPVSVKGRTSSITNAFFNWIIPIEYPSNEEVETALEALGMTRETICCAYCGDSCTEWDHFFPLIENKRPTGFISEIHNLVPCCGKCNQSKGNKNWKSWIQSDAKQSPKTRRIADLADRIEKLEYYEKRFSRKKYDYEGMVGRENWKQYIQEMDTLHEMLKTCQKQSDIIKARIKERAHTDK